MCCKAPAQEGQADVGEGERDDEGEQECFCLHPARMHY